MQRQSRHLAELEGLYRGNFEAFVRVASALAGSVTLGHEAVQEAFARAIEAVDRFRGEGTLEAWLWRIVVNTAKNARERAELELPDDLERLDNGNGHAELTPLEAWIRVLPERQRLAVFLRYWADLDYRSIAAVLEVEVGTVSATLSAAHQSLRNSLEEVSS